MATANKPVPKAKPRISAKPSSVSATNSVDEDVPPPPPAIKPRSVPEAPSLTNNHVTSNNVERPAPTARSRQNSLIGNHQNFVPSSNHRNVDAAGNYVDFDVREDEEQIEKLQEIIELLVAAGYFRARIKGLSSFDKIVGGMTWAVEMCNVDIDVDLLFQESLTIGQKIALTEKIVKVLQKMQCPFRLEPHQMSIQGMDFIHIFPVIQWLIKKSIEFRHEMGAYIKNYAVGQFNRHHQLAQDLETAALKKRAKDSISEVDIANKPRRKYRHPAKHKITEEKSNVKTTLLEYGRSALDVGSEQSVSESEVDAADKQMEKLYGDSDQQKLADSRISASLVGSIVGERADEIQALAEEYVRKQKELLESSAEGKERALRRKLEEARQALTSVQEKAPALEERRRALQLEIARIKEAQAAADPKVLEESVQEKERRAALIQLIDRNKKERSEFKQRCREEKARLDKEIEVLANESFESEDEVGGEALAQLDAARDKLDRVKLKLAKQNKLVALYQRKLDDIPSRPELTQYQKRFVELYDQVAAKHIETKKFYILYNQCDDTRIQLEMELKLLNNILESFNIASTSPNAREPFLTQFEQIVESIRTARTRVTNRMQVDKSKRDKLNEQYLEQVEKQRLYYKSVKDFTEECRKNELLVENYKASSKPSTPVKQ